MEPYYLKANINECGIYPKTTSFNDDIIIIKAHRWLFTIPTEYDLRLTGKVLILSFKIDFHYLPRYL